MPKNIKTANAGTSSSISVSEIWDDGYFIKDNLDILYEYLTGKTDAEYEDLENMFLGETAYSAAAIRRKVYALSGLDEDLIVELGGFKWTVVYMSQVDRQDSGGGSSFAGGDIILTLWLADTDELSSDSSPVKWSGYSSLVSAQSTDTYPINVYGTSNIRTKVLNNGGTLATDRDSAIIVEKDENSEWAAFTMSQSELQAKGSELISLTDFLVTPSQVAYQETECNSVTGYYRYPNDCYGEIASSWYSSVFASYPGKQSYNEWRYDYLWLPSLTETGARLGATGIWETRQAQMATSTGQYSWLRSGDTSGGAPYGVYYMNNIGNGVSTVSPLSDNCAARPALHLNLTAANDSCGIEMPEADANNPYVYNGNEHEYKPEGFKSKVMDIVDNKQTDAGTYTVTVSLKNGYNWIDGTTDALEFDFNINKADPKVTPVVNGTSVLYETDSMPVLSLSPGDTAGTISWKAGQKLIAGTNNYTWEFTPTDANNYNTYSGVKSLTVIGVAIKSISAVYANPDGDNIYSIYKLDALRPYLTVTATYNNGATAVITDYALSVAGGGDTIPAGKNVSITVRTDDGKFTTATVDEVILAYVTGLDPQFSQGANVITPSTPLDDLKQWLKVYADLNTGDSLKLEDDDYELSGKLVKGTSTVTVEYEGITETFTVNVTDPNNPSVPSGPSAPSLNYLPVPGLEDLRYSGTEIDILDGYQYLNLISVTGNKATTVGKYTVIMTITASNYFWQTNTTAKKSSVKYSITSVSDDGLTVSLEWNILPAILTARWNKNGTLDLSSDSYTGTYENVVGYVYKDADGNIVARDDLKKGEQYSVTPVLTDNNFTLDANSMQVFADGGTYTPEFSTGEKILNFFKANWLWFVIAVAVLIFLIILIAIISKRRKTKEERAKKKAADKERREEEKRRKEEEKRKREQEEADRKEKLQAEKELQKAKQEAELAKIKAQAEMNAGMAGLAMAAKSNQAPAQPQQAAQAGAPANSGIADINNAIALARLEAEVSALKAAGNNSTVPATDNAVLSRIERDIAILRATQGTVTPAPSNPAAESVSAGGLAGIQAELSAMRAEARNAREIAQAVAAAEARIEQKANAEMNELKLQTEFAKLKSELKSEEKTESVPQVNSSGMDVLGALVISALKNLANPVAVIRPAKTETKDVQKAVRTDDGRLFDIDGFYDAFDENK